MPLFARQSGEVYAYFVGRDAVYSSVVGLAINGTPTGVTGLNNLTSSVGQFIDLGYAPIGATLTPFIYVQNTGSTFYSNAALNSDGISHAYEAAFAGGTLPGSNVMLPKGTYVGFEDLIKGAQYSDYDYNDSMIILTNSTTTPPTILGTPTPIAGAGLVPLLGLFGAWYSRRRQNAA